EGPLRHRDRSCRRDDVLEFAHCGERARGARTVAAAWYASLTTLVFRLLTIITPMTAILPEVESLRNRHEARSSSYLTGRRRCRGPCRRAGNADRWNERAADRRNDHRKAAQHHGPGFLGQSTGRQPPE